MNPGRTEAARSAKAISPASPSSDPQGPRHDKHGRAEFDAVEQRIAYRFADRRLLEQALSHISAFAGIRNRASSYQRLEFLGDHVLGLVVSDMLFRAFAKADEGEMSRRLADLVRKEACADVGRAIDLGVAIRLGASEANAGGRSRIAILADVCEAMIGAVFVDGGYPAAGGALDFHRPARGNVTGFHPVIDDGAVEAELARHLGLGAEQHNETVGTVHGYSLVENLP